jgi:hypothetical protein
MKSALAAALVLALAGTAFAQTGTDLRTRLRLADATSDACMANCSNANASCKRVCPTTFNAPCLSACDSQAQTCRQGCQPR